MKIKKSQLKELIRETIQDNKVDEGVSRENVHMDVSNTIEEFIDYIVKNRRKIENAYPVYVEDKVFNSWDKGNINIKWKIESLLSSFEKAIKSGG